MFISTAYAQSAPAPAAGGDPIAMFLPLILIFVVFYFLMIRPQNKRMKEHRAMLEAVRRGDRVVTGGGIIGKVAKVMDNGEVEVEIARDVRVKVLRSTIQTVLDKTQPAGSGDKPSKERDKDKGDKPASATDGTEAGPDGETDRPAG